MMVLNNVSVRTRLNVGYSIILLFTAIITAIGLNRMEFIANSLIQVTDVDYAMVAQINKMRDSVRFQSVALRDIVMQEDLAFKKRELKLLKEARVRYKEAADGFHKLADEGNAEVVSAFTSVEESEERAKEAAMLATDLTLDDKHAEAGEAVREKVRPAQIQLIEKLDALLLLLDKQSKASATDARQAYKTAFNSMLLFGLLAVILGIVIAYIISQSVVTPLRAAALVAERISNGDLSADIKISGSDETSHLLSALQRMNTNLANIIRNVKSAATTGADLASNLSAATEQVSTRVQNQSDWIMAMTTSMEQMSASSNEIHQGSAGVLGVLNTTNEVVDKNSEVIKTSMEASKRVAISVEASFASIHELSDAIQKITDVASVINGIADQTNLLALNATIEAARAGEQGRGFAVVADEVRILSQRTATSTAEISNMVATIRRKTIEAVSAMDKVKLEVSVDNGRNEQLFGAMEQIATAASQAMALAHHIADSTREQTAATEDIAKNMTKISHISEENAETVKSTADVATELSHSAEMLEQLISHFSDIPSSPADA
ncbi:MAG: methyl-accepting chemotaxis protein [Gammaproteobacteria bacterium]|nr:methyl-accepting chemotaxis protein [Gammaproteobacteria bacterium]